MADGASMQASPAGAFSSAGSAHTSTSWRSHAPLPDAEGGNAAAAGTASHAPLRAPSLRWADSWASTTAMLSAVSASSPAGLGGGTAAADGSDGSPKQNEGPAGAWLRRPSALSLRYAGLAATSFFGYGFAMFINGAARAVLYGRGAGALPSPVEADASLPVLFRLLYAQCEPMYYLSSWRVVASALLWAGLRVRRVRRERRTPLPAVAAAHVPPPPPPTVGKLLLPVTIGVCNCAGYLFFNTLCALNGVSLWSSLIGCYVVVPVVYGLAARREGTHATKLAGIALCVGAVLLLSLSQASGGDAEAEAIAASAGDGGGGGAGGVLLRGSLFVAAALVWGVCDTAASYVSRGPDALPTESMVALTGLGFGLVAWACAGLGYVIAAHAAPLSADQLLAAAAAAMTTSNGTLPGGAATTTTTTSASRWWAGQAVLAAGQALGVAAWFAFTRLGALPGGAEASSIVPLISTYTIFSAALGIALLGESLSPPGYVGMALAAAGVVAISWPPPSPPRGGGGGGGGGTAKAGDEGEEGAATAAATAANSGHPLPAATTASSHGA